MGKSPFKCVLLSPTSTIRPILALLLLLLHCNLERVSESWRRKSNLEEETREGEWNRENEKNLTQGTKQPSSFFCECVCSSRVWSEVGKVERGFMGPCGGNSNCSSTVERKKAIISAGLPPHSQKVFPAAGKDCEQIVSKQRDLEFEIAKSKYVEFFWYI